MQGTYFEPCKITWSEFRDRFDELRYPNLKPGTVQCYESTFNRLELLIIPHRLSQINTMAVARFQNKLRGLGNADTTVAKHLRHLKAALTWAKSMEFIPKLPVFNMPKRGKHQRLMKGRPITDAEFQRMLDAVESVVGSESAQSWRDLITGVALSGLRIDEALALTWHRSSKLFVDLASSEYPMFRIQSDGEKGGKDRLLPMTPDFAQFLDEIGYQESGFVFKPGRVKNGKKQEFRRSIVWVSKIGSRIGECAIVKVGDGAHKKYASFHDLRRRFGQKWASVVMPQTLMHLMRHESIETTLRYYVGLDATRIAHELWTSWP
ncbi:MAG: tyrosine-type recombinase/integrase [Planctomycetota bacterium]